MMVRVLVMAIAMKKAFDRVILAILNAQTVKKYRNVQAVGRQEEGGRQAVGSRTAVQSFPTRAKLEERNPSLIASGNFLTEDVPSRKIIRAVTARMIFRLRTPSVEKIIRAVTARIIF